MQPCGIRDLSFEQVQQLGDLPWWRSALKAALLGHIPVNFCDGEAGWVLWQRTCLSEPKLGRGCCSQQVFLVVKVLGLVGVGAVA